MSTIKAPPHYADEAPLKMGWGVTASICFHSSRQTNTSTRFCSILSFMGAYRFNSNLLGVNFIKKHCDAFSRPQFVRNAGKTLHTWTYGRRTSGIEICITACLKGSRRTQTSLSTSHLVSYSSLSSDMDRGTQRAHTHGNHGRRNGPTSKSKRGTETFPSISSVPPHWDIVEEGAWFGMSLRFLRGTQANMCYPAVCDIYKPTGSEVFLFCVLWSTTAR